MSLYKEFSDLLPYLQSVRKIKDYFSFDVLFPLNWRLPKKYVDESRVMEQESKVATQRFLSFVADINEEGVDTTTSNIKNIIKYNLEREEKERLFEDKVSELKLIFEKQNLRKLKSLKFDLNSNKIELDDEEELRPTEMVRNSNEER